MSPSPKSAVGWALTTELLVSEEIQDPKGRASALKARGLDYLSQLSGLIQAAEREYLKCVDAEGNLHPTREFYEAEADIEFCLRAIQGIPECARHIREGTWRGSRRKDDIQAVTVARMANRHELHTMRSRA